MSARHASLAGQSPPEIDSARGANAGRIGEQGEQDKAIVGHDAGRGEVEATLITQIALHRGHVVTKLPGGGYAPGAALQRSFLTSMRSKRWLGGSRRD